MEMFVDRRSEEEKRAMAKDNAARLKMGDKVIHRTFGKGEVTYIDSENARVHISFENADDKKLTLVDIFKYIEIIKQ